MNLFRKFDCNNVKSKVNNHYNHPDTNPLVIHIVFVHRYGYWRSFLADFGF